MKNFLVILVLLAGCDGSGVDLPGDAGIGTSTTTGTTTKTQTATVTSTATNTQTATGSNTDSGVYTNLGPNPCENAVQHPECASYSGTTLLGYHCCWRPDTNTCYNQRPDGTALCEPVDPATHVDIPGDFYCGTQERYAYLGNASGGRLCLACKQFIGGSCVQ